MKKIDFTMEKQNGVDVIKYVLGAADVYDERVSDKASEMPNIIPFQYQDVDGKRIYTAYAHEDITLDAYMKNVLTKPEVLGVLGGLASIFEIGTKGIPVGYIVKDASYIYVNRENITVKAVLFPLKQDNMPLSEIPAFFREIISNMKFHEADVDNYVARIITQINAPDFTAGSFKAFIDAEMEKIGMFIHKDNGPMNMMIGGGKTPNKDVKVNKVGVMNNMNNMNNMRPPMGQPVPPMGRPMGPQGQPMPPMGQPVPPMGRPMGPQGQPVPAMGQPVPPMGRPMGPQGQPMPAPGVPGAPVPPQGQPVPPMGRPMGPQGQPMPAPGTPVPPQGQPMPALGAPVPPQGQPMPAPGAPGAPVPPQGQPMPAPGAPVPPQGQPMPVPGAPVPPQGQPVQADVKTTQETTENDLDNKNVEEVEKQVEDTKEETIDKKEDFKAEANETNPSVMPQMPGQGAPTGMPMPGMKSQGAPAGMPMPGMPQMPGQGAPTGMPMPGMKSQGAPAGMPMPGMKSQGAPAGMPMPGMPQMPGQGAPVGMPMPGMPQMPGQGAPAGMPMPGMKPQGTPAGMPMPGMPQMSGQGAPTGMSMPGMKPQGTPAGMPQMPDQGAPTGMLMPGMPQMPAQEASTGMPVMDTPAEKPQEASMPNPQPASAVAEPGSTVGNLVGKLGDKPVPHLVRKKTGEIINLSKPEFTLGKAVGKVDYAITDNTAVSRVHCIIAQKNGVNYIKDNGSTNHTYVDGAELEPQKEVLLKNKMTILLGDEEFTFLLRRGE